MPLKPTDATSSKGSDSKETNKKVKPPEITPADQNVVAGSAADLTKNTSIQAAEQLLGQTLVTAIGDSVSPNTFVAKDGVIALYFAAHWCPPCKTFSPNLMLLYDELKAASQPFEVVYVSLDSQEDSFNTYFSKMPWHAIAYDHEEKREELVVNFGVQSIPILIFLDASNLQVITRNGREVVLQDPRGALFPWNDLNKHRESDIDVPASSAAQEQDPKKDSQEQANKGSDKGTPRVSVSSRKSVAKGKNKVKSSGSSGSRASSQSLNSSTNVS